jgi:outer membrane protein OmpA-like peptidoglycan-associated protein
MLRSILSILLVVSVFASSGCRSDKEGDVNELGINISTHLPGEQPLPDGDFTASLTPVNNVHFETIRFAYDSHTIAQSEIRKIERVARQMRANRSLRLVTEGHCDERGSKEYNLSLGENRAGSVRMYLLQLGVPAANVQTRSFGEEQPMNPSHNESAWRSNRRVEFALYR